MDHDTTSRTDRARQPVESVELTAESTSESSDYSARLASRVGNASILGSLRGDGGHARFLRGELLLHVAGVAGGEEEWASNTAQQNALRRPAGGGSTLDRRTKARMERAFGHDFGHVRVHVDSAAAAFAEDLHAHAAALGADLFFGAGQYKPGTKDGDRLLAHELTHVVQHDRGQLTGKTGVSDPSDAHEREAYANEDRILAVLHTNDLAVESAPRAEAMPQAVADRAEDGLGVSLRETDGPSTSAPASESSAGSGEGESEEQDYTSIIELLKESEGREVVGELPDIDTDQTEVPVILHDDDPAQQAAEELGRLAFSLGAHLFLGEEASLEDAAEQPELLDELTHLSIGESSAAELALADQLLTVEAEEDSETTDAAPESGSESQDQSQEAAPAPEAETDTADAQGADAATEPVQEIPGVTDEDHSGLREAAWELETEEQEEQDQASGASGVETGQGDEEEGASDGTGSETESVESPSLDAAGRIEDVPTYEVAAGDELSAYAEAKASFFNGLGEEAPAPATQEVGAADPEKLELDTQADTDPRASTLQYESSATQTVDAGITEATEATPNTATFLATDEQVTDGPTAWWGDPASESRSKGSEDVEASYSDSGRTKESAQDYSGSQGDADAGAADTQSGLGSMMSFVAPATMLVPGISEKTAEAESSSSDLGETTPVMGELDGQLQDVEGKAANTEAGAIDADPQVQVERAAEAKQRQTDLVASYESARGQEAYPAGSLAAETGEAMSSAVAGGAGTVLPGEPMASARAEVSSSEEGGGDAIDLSADLEEIAASMPAAEEGAESSMKPATKPAMKPATKPAMKPATKPAMKPATKPATAPSVAPTPTTELPEAVKSAAPVDNALAESAMAGDGAGLLDDLMSAEAGPELAEPALEGPVAGGMGGAAAGGAGAGNGAASGGPGEAGPSTPPPVEHEGLMTDAALQIREMNVEQRQLDLQLASLDEVDARIEVENQAIDQAESLNAASQSGLDVQDEELDTKRSNQEELDADLGEHEEQGSEVEEAAEEEQGGLAGILSSIMGLFDFFGPLLAGLTGEDGGEEVDEQFGKGAEGGAAVAEDAAAGQDANAAMQDDRVSAEDDSKEARAQTEALGGSLAEDRGSNQTASERAVESREAATGRIEELEAQKQDQFSTYSESKSELLGWVEGEQAEAGGPAPAPQADKSGADEDKDGKDEEGDGESQGSEGVEVDEEQGESTETSESADASGGASTEASGPELQASPYEPAGADFNFHTEAFGDFQAEMREQLALDGIEEIPELTGQGPMEGQGEVDEVDDGPLDAGEKFDLIWDALALGGVAGFQDGMAGLGQEVMYTVGEVALERLADQGQSGFNRVVDYGAKKSGKQIYRAGTKTSQASAKMIAKGGGKGAASTGLKGAAKGASKGAGSGMAKGLVKGGGAGMAKGAAKGAATGAAKGTAKGVAKGIGKGLGKVVPGVGAGVGGLITLADIAITRPDQWAIQQFEGTVGMGIGGAKKVFGKDADIWTRLDGLLDMVEMLNNALELLVTVLDLVALALVAVAAALAALGAILCIPIVTAEIGAAMIVVASVILEVAAVISYISLAIGLIVLAVMLVLLGLRALINLGRASTIALSDADASVQQERADALQEGVEGVTSTAVGAAYEVGGMAGDHLVDGLASGNVGAEADADGGSGESQTAPWSEAARPDGDQTSDGPTIGSHRTSHRPSSGPTIGAHRLPPPPTEAAATHETSTQWAKALIDKDAALIASLEHSSKVRQIAEHRVGALEQNKAAADANEAQIGQELATLDDKDSRNAEASSLAGQAGSEGDGVMSGMDQVASDSQSSSGELAGAESSAPPEAGMQPTDDSALDNGDTASESSAAGEVGPGLQADSETTGAQIAGARDQFSDLRAQNAAHNAQLDAEIAQNQQDLEEATEAEREAEEDRVMIQELLDEQQEVLDQAAVELEEWTRESAAVREEIEQEQGQENAVDDAVEATPEASDESADTSRDIDINDIGSVMGPPLGFSDADSMRPEYPTTFNVWLDANSRQSNVSGVNLDTLAAAYDGVDRIEAVIVVDGKSQTHPVETLQDLDDVYRSIDYKRTADHKQQTTGRGHGKDVMKDRHVAESGLGGDVGASANDVGVMSYNRNIGDSGTNVGFYKPDGANMVSDDARGVGIPEGGHFAARAVASSRLDRALGTDVLSHDHFASHNGGRGVVSAQTQGQATLTNVYEVNDRMTQHLADQDFTPDDLINMGFKVDDNGVVSSLVDTNYAEVDLTNALTQKGLSDLQVMDFLTGQVDRHGGNIFIDESGQVTGIDNDLAFGSNNDNLSAASNQMGMPSQIDAKTADAVLNMRSRDFMKIISGKRGDYGKLSGDEKRAAKQRLNDLKAHIRDLKKDGKLVDQWDDGTYREAIAGDDGSSYMQRADASLKYQAEAPERARQEEEKRAEAERREAERLAAEEEAEAVE